MRRLCLLFYLLLLGGLSGCGRKTPGVPTKKEFTNWTNAGVQLDQITFDWIMWLTWAGMACMVIGVVYMIWFARKDIGIRIIITGVALSMTAKGIVLYETYDWLVWAAIIVGSILYCALYPTWAEKILGKVGIYIDLNNDGKSGTGRTARKLGKRKWWIFHEPYIEPVDQDKIETETISQNQD